MSRRPRAAKRDEVVRRTVIGPGYLPEGAEPHGHGAYPPIGERDRSKVAVFRPRLVLRGDSRQC